MSIARGLNDHEAQHRLAVMSQPTRFEIMCTLSRSPMGVMALSEQIGRTPGTISHHVQALREAGLVSTSRWGLCIDTWGMVQVQAFLKRMVDDAR